MCVAQPPAPKGEDLIIVELAEKADAALGGFGKITDATKYAGDAAARRAFRQFNWAAYEPVRNRSGNLRGMVINKKMRTIFQVTKPVTDFVDKHSAKLALAGALIEIGKDMGRMETVLKSDMADSEKYSRSVLLGSAAILRSVTSVVPATFELASTAAQGYLMLYSEATGHQAGNRIAKQFDALDKQVTAIHRKQWDGETWYNVIEATID